MAKFNVPDPNDMDTPVKPAMDEVRVINGLPPIPKPATVNPNATTSLVTVNTTSITASPVPTANTVTIPVVPVGYSAPDQTSIGSAVMAQQTVQTQAIAASTQAQASVGLSEASIDKEVVDEQIKKEEEHWMKQYWRPGMGWLYMLICFCDFVFFPMLTMFLPVIERGFGVTVGYTPWQSLTLSNGGLIHLAFGAILGVSAWTRGQEKLAKI